MGGSISLPFGEMTIAKGVMILDTPNTSADKRVEVARRAPDLIRKLLEKTDATPAEFRSAYELLILLSFGVGYGPIFDEPLEMRAALEAASVELAERCLAQSRTNRTISQGGVDTIDEIERRTGVVNAALYLCWLATDEGLNSRLLVLAEAHLTDLGDVLHHHRNHARPRSSSVAQVEAALETFLRALYTFFTVNHDAVAARDMNIDKSLLNPTTHAPLVRLRFSLPGYASLLGTLAKVFVVRLADSPAVRRAFLNRGFFMHVAIRETIMTALSDALKNILPSLATLAADAMPDLVALLRQLRPLCYPGAASRQLITLMGEWWRTNTTERVTMAHTRNVRDQLAEVLQGGGWARAKGILSRGSGGGLVALIGDVGETHNNQQSAAVIAARAMSFTEAGGVELTLDILLWSYVPVRETTNDGNDVRRLVLSSIEYYSLNRTLLECVTHHSDSESRDRPHARLMDAVVRRELVTVWFAILRGCVQRNTVQERPVCLLLSHLFDDQNLNQANQ